MSQNSLRSQLSSAHFPFLSGKMGRTIVLPQYDQNFDRTNQGAGESDTLGKGVPQVYYMHNVMPIVEGYQSVAFKQQIPGVEGVDNFNQVFPLRDSNDNNFLYVPADGDNYVFTGNLAAWQTTDPFPVGAVYKKTNISYAYIQNQHYICVQGQGVFQYDAELNVLNPVNFDGLVMTEIRGICTSSGYLLCYDSLSVYWSSAVTPTDFVPSLITGAGSGAPTDAKGDIVTVLQISGGFIIYTTANIVSAQYSGNIRYPFIFKEVVNSGGLQRPEQVSYVSNSSEHFAITSAGIQKIDRNQATAVFDDATDFISCNKFEDFNPDTLVFSEQTLLRPLFTKLVLISARYLVLSYGVVDGLYTHCIVYDLALKRWGKLKIAHVDSFEYNWPNRFGPVSYADMKGTTIASYLGTSYRDISAQQRIAPTPRTSIAFIQADGAVYTVEMADGAPAADSVFVLGKYQFVRSRVFQLHSVDIDNLYTEHGYAVYALPSLDGKNNGAPVLGSILGESANTVHAGFRLTALNVSLMLMGTFSLNCVTVNFSKTGQR